MAAILLGKANVLILDEPGNHLDVETVEALADALIAYEGTVIFTSHDRHFLKRVASAFIEVRDGAVTHYRGDYDAYLYMVQKEIDDEESRRHAAKPCSSGKTNQKTPTPKTTSSLLDERQLRKQIGQLEKQIARLDAQKKTTHERWMQATDPSESMRLHEELTKIQEELSEAETRWTELQEQIESA
jgi:ATP-binding cassette subfamily F protein 3